MKALRLAIGAFLILPGISTAQSFDWSAQLGSSPRAFESALGSSAKCSAGRFSVPVEFIDATTTVAPELFEPVQNTSVKRWAPILSEPDLSVDRNGERRYAFDQISTINCIIGKEATAAAYAFNDVIFRIALGFDRCKTREERKNTLIGTVANPFVYTACDGIDMREKDFDTALFKSVEARNTFGYNDQGEPGMLDFRWSKNMRGEHEADERRNVASLWCRGRNEIGDMLSRLSDGETYRCLIDVDNADARKWSATAIYEVFKPGIISNEVTSRLTSQRLFIDMPTEHAAAKAMLPGLQAVIDGVKRQIATRVDAKVSEDKSVSKILGAQN